MTRLHRLFQLLQSLRRMTPPVTAEALAQDLNVSIRTVYRDVETLRGIGAVIDGTAGYGYVLTEDPSLPPLSFNDEEIEALVLGLREVRQTADAALAEAAGAALSKLKARLAPAQAHRLQHAVLTARRYTPRAPISIDTRALRQAAWQERAVDISYRDEAGQASTRRVLPLSIVFFGHALCLMGWCQLRSDFRAFRLDRIVTLDVTTESFRPRRASLLRDYMEKIRSTWSEPNPPSSLQKYPGVN